MLQELVDQARREDEILEDETVLKETVSELDGSKLEYKRMQFFHCRFVDCDFSGAEFYHCSWYGCDFSRCRFSESYFKQTLIQASRGDAGVFTDSVFRQCRFQDSSFCYANFFVLLLEECLFSGMQLRQGVLARVKLKKTRWESADLTGAELFQTPLKGVDLSHCEIAGITLSDSFSELRGAKISPLQAVDVARMLGVQIL